MGGGGGRECREVFWCKWRWCGAAWGGRSAGGFTADATVTPSAAVGAGIISSAMCYLLIKKKKKKILTVVSGVTAKREL